MHFRSIAGSHYCSYICRAVGSIDLCSVLPELVDFFLCSFHACRATSLCETVETNFKSAV